MPTIFKTKYYKYKSKYYNLLSKMSAGINYDIDDEASYKTATSVNINDMNNFEFITGPTSMSLYKSELFSATILTLGDTHICTNNGFSTDKKNMNKEIYIVDYLDLLFKKYHNRQFDVLIELPYRIDKTIGKMQCSFLENFRKKFNVCFDNLTDKTLCIKNYPNVRFHAVDVRYWSVDLSTNADPKFDNELQKFIYLLDTSNDFMYAINDMISETLKENKKYYKKTYNIYWNSINNKIEKMNVIIDHDAIKTAQNIMNLILSNYKFERYQDLFLIDEVNDFIMSQIVYNLKKNNMYIYYKKFQDDIKKVNEENEDLIDKKYFITLSTCVIHFISFFRDVGASIMDYVTLVRFTKILNYQKKENILGDNIIYMAGNVHIRTFNSFLLSNPKLKFNKIFTTDNYISETKLIEINNFTNFIMDEARQLDDMNNINWNIVYDCYQLRFFLSQIIKSNIPDIIKKKSQYEYITNTDLLTTETTKNYNLVKECTTKIKNDFQNHLDDPSTRFVKVESFQIESELS